MPYFDFVRMTGLPKWRPGGFDKSAFMQLAEQGVVSIGGTGGGVIDLPFSLSQTINKHFAEEEKRKFDVVRRYYTRPDGSIDFNSYVDYEVVTEVSYANGSRDAFAKPTIDSSSELIAEEQSRYNSR